MTRLSQRTARSVRHAFVACGAAVSVWMFTLGGDAALTIDVQYVDAPREGFFDETLAPAADGNPGRNRGEQRRAAFEHALEIWAQALDSPVSVVVEARFSQVMACSGSSVVLGAAAPTSLLRGFTGAPRGDRYYASALADRLAGRDLDPTSPDIEASFNPALDTTECPDESGWDYSIGPTAGATSFVATALHELAHGFGFLSGVAPATGSSDPGFTPFDGLLFDRRLGRYWDQMTPEERSTSARSPLQLVWAGSAVNRRAPEILAQGAPYLDVSVFDAELEVEERFVLSLVAEVNQGPRVGAEPVSGTLLALPGALSCGELGVLDDAVVLLSSQAPCGIDERLLATSRAGAAAVLLEASGPELPPAAPRLTEGEISSPTLVLTQDDFAELSALSSERLVGVALALDETRLAGTDSAGRVLMHASEPLVAGSSIAHFDPSARRPAQVGQATGVLMEPVVREVVAVDVGDLTAQLLFDIGWADAECGNGELEPGEGCDDGADNSNSSQDACRVDCRLPRCGDGVVDSDEQCDDGPALGDCPRDCGREADAPLPPFTWDGGPAPVVYEPPPDDAGKSPGDAAGATDSDADDASDVETDGDAESDVETDDTSDVETDGMAPPDAGAADDLDAGALDAGAPTFDAGDAGMRVRASKEGCGCTLPGAPQPDVAWAWLSMAALLSAARARRAR